eukprot:361402-Chlamydomonas_euryale.AAC.1
MHRAFECHSHAQTSPSPVVCTGPVSAGRMHTDSGCPGLNTRQPNPPPPPRALLWTTFLADLCPRHMHEGHTACAPVLPPRLPSTQLRTKPIFHACHACRSGGVGGGTQSRPLSRSALCSAAAHKSGMQASLPA